jgi:hypothetical protein
MFLLVIFDRTDRTRLAIKGAFFLERKCRIFTVVSGFPLPSLLLASTFVEEPVPFARFAFGFGSLSLIVVLEGFEAFVDLSDTFLIGFFPFDTVAESTSSEGVLADFFCGDLAFTEISFRGDFLVAAFFEVGGFCSVDFCSSTRRDSFKAFSVSFDFEIGVSEFLVRRWPRILPSRTSCRAVEENDA